MADISKTAVLGAGSWGTALAYVLAQKGYGVRLWARRPELSEAISSARRNERYLPAVPLPNNILVTSSIEQALSGADVIVLAVPSSGLREVASSLCGKLPPNSILVHAGKGLESETSYRGSQVLAEVLSERAQDCVVLSGPNLAVELAHGIPTATVLASAQMDKAVCVQEMFHSQCFRAYTNQDVIGVELGGAIKNVLAIGAGISDGLGFGDNTKATLVTRGLAEMTRLGVALGANPKTFTGLSGIGDLMATCASRLSRNLRLGLLIGGGMTLDKALAEIGQVAEGAPTCAAAFTLAQKHEVYTPITTEIHAILFEGKPAKQAVTDLMLKERKFELS